MLALFESYSDKIARSTTCDMNANVEQMLHGRRTELREQSAKYAILHDPRYIQSCYYCKVYTIQYIYLLMS